MSISSTKSAHASSGDPVENGFDMHASAQKQQALNQAAETGTLSKDQAKGMSAEEKAAFEKANKERAEMKAKGKALNDAFNAGKEAMTAKQFDVAVTQFRQSRRIERPISRLSGPTLATPKSTCPRPKPVRSTTMP